MKVHKKIGSPERFKEMFQNINKIKLNESFDNQIEKDEKYLNKGGDQEDINVQPNKYDDGYREPRERDIQVKDNSVERMVGDDKPIEPINEDAYQDTLKTMQITYQNMVKKYGHGNPVVTSYENYLQDFIKLSGNDEFRSSQEILNKPTGDQQKTNIERQYGVGSPQAKAFGESEEEDISIKNNTDGNPRMSTNAGTRTVTSNGMKLPDEKIGEPQQFDRNMIEKGKNPQLDIPKMGESDDEEIDMGGEEVTDVEIVAQDNGEEAIEGGLADGASPADFDPKQILMGMEVEMEHTHTPHEALEIAMDHLKEDPAYYGNEGENPDLEAQDNAQDDASEIEAEVVGSEETGEEVPEKMEDDDLGVNMNWLETIKPKKVDDMEF